MSAFCLLAAGTLVASISTPLLTLSWTHSIEKILWEEDYRIEGQKLTLSAARIRGNGAGMEPPEGASLRAGVWHYRPQLAQLEKLTLARSPAVADYTLCWQGHCRPLADLAGTAQNNPIVELTPCPQ